MMFVHSFLTSVSFAIILYSDQLVRNALHSAAETEVCCVNTELACSTPVDAVEQSRYQCNALLQLEHSTQNKMVTKSDKYIMLLIIIMLFTASQKNLL